MHCTSVKTCAKLFSKYNKTIFRAHMLSQLENAIYYTKFSGHDGVVHAFNPSTKNTMAGLSLVSRQSGYILNTMSKIK